MAIRFKAKKIRTGTSEAFIVPKPIAENLEKDRKYTIIIEELEI